MLRSPSEFPAVHLLHLERVGIHVIETAHIDRNHVGAVARTFSAREGLNPAGRAEQMMDGVPVELIFRRRVFASEQLEVRGRRKREQRTESTAARAVHAITSPMSAETS